MQRIQITDEHIGKRLDVAVFELTENFSSRAKAAQAIRNGLVTVNGKIAKPSYMLKSEDSVTVEPSQKKSGLLKPNPSLDIPVIKDTIDFLIIHKPAGIQVHPSNAEKENTVVNWLVARCPKVKDVGEDFMRPGIVHRLDKDTSGVMVIAKTQKAFEALKTTFSDRKVAKEYVALVYGHLKNSHGIIDLPIARSQSFRKQVIVRSGTTHKGSPREAVTEYEVTKEFTDSLLTTHYSLLTVRPRTGRMHQIRIHLSAIGHPVVGDKLYIRKEYPNPKNLTRFLLHAQSLTFPLFGKEYSFATPLPEDFEEFIKMLEVNTHTRT